MPLVEISKETIEFLGLDDNKKSKLLGQMEIINTLYNQAQKAIQKLIPIAKEVNEILRPFCREFGSDTDEFCINICEFRKGSDICRKVSEAVDDIGLLDIAEREE